MISEELARCLRSTLEIHIASHNNDEDRAEDIQWEIDADMEFLNPQEITILHLIDGDILDAFKLLRGQKTIGELMRQSRAGRDAELAAWYKSVQATLAHQGETD
jgi:hypothetical protein